MEKILIVDDDHAVYRSLAIHIERMGCEAVWRNCLAEGLAEVEKHAYDLVLLDVHLPDGCGLDAISTIRRAASQPEVIILTGYGDVNGAEVAIKNGVWDYIQKSASPQEVALSLKRVVEYRKEKVEQPSKAFALKLDGIVGDSAPMQACYDQLARAASGDANVLLSGETGTGKEIFARAIHTNSSRIPANMVVVDCAALPETLVESLLFGHEKGVYTGADKARDGLIAQADGGTLFLDEVGELPLPIQKVFLRVLQERKYRSVGGRCERSSNFRLIAATNRDLDAMVAAGTFRSDLLYRLRTIAIELPPLRDRTTDIAKLVTHYLSVISERCGTAIKGVSPDLMETISAYTWPGNVRELINALETAFSNACCESTLYARHLPQDIRLQVIQCSLESGSHSGPAHSDGSGRIKIGSAFPAELTTFRAFRKAAIFDIEKQYLKALLDKSDKRLDQSLDISGLSRSRFYDLLKQHNLSL